MKNLTRSIKTIFSLILFLFALKIHALNELHPSTLELQEFIDQMATKYHFDKTELDNLFKQAQYLPDVIDRISHPYEKKPWDYYRKYFLTEERIRLGTQYWQTHRHITQQIANEYGVDPSVVIAIVGIESLYGTQMGRFQELGALTTLAFNYPPRANFFKKELEHYLILTRDSNLPAHTLTGSYAGALGIPQFMPSSYRHFGVDFSKNKTIDLLSNHNDALASVANYLKESHWEANKPVATPAIIHGQIPPELISGKIKLNHTLEEFARHGITPKYPLDPQLKASLIVLQNEHSQEYWLVFKNFRAIYAYNRNLTYAMAVFQLSQAISKNMKIPIKYE